MTDLKPCPALSIKPIHLAPAREFVKQYHRHNIPPVGGKFAVACYADNGKPIFYKRCETPEIARAVVDGQNNSRRIDR